MILGNFPSNKILCMVFIGLEESQHIPRSYFLTGRTLSDLSDRICSAIIAAYAAINCVFVNNCLSEWGAGEGVDVAAGGGVYDVCADGVGVASDFVVAQEGNVVAVDYLVKAVATIFVARSLDFGR